MKHPYQIPWALVSLISFLASVDTASAGLNDAVSVWIGPSHVSACVAEPVILQATVVNKSTEDVRFNLTGRDWLFSVARRDGEAIASRLYPYPMAGLENFVSIKLTPGETISFKVAFPILLMSFTNTGGQRARLGPGSYMVTWDCNDKKAPNPFPYSEDDPPSWPWLTASGSFELSVKERNEDGLAQAYEGLRDRFVQYQDRWPERHRDPVATLEWKALIYTFDAIEDEFALPYLEEMKAVDNKWMNELAENAVRRIR